MFPKVWVSRSPMFLCLFNASIGGCFHTCFSSLSFKIVFQLPLRILLILIVLLPFAMSKERVEFSDIVCKLLESYQFVHLNSGGSP